MTRGQSTLTDAVWSAYGQGIRLGRPIDHGLDATSRGYVVISGSITTRRKASSPDRCHNRAVELAYDSAGQTVSRFIDGGRETMAYGRGG